MFLRCSVRKKDGKTHHYWSIVENKRLSGGKVVQRHVLYLGEINDRQEAAWRKTIEVFGEDEPVAKTMALFAEDREATQLRDEEVVHIRLKEMELRRPRQWGACWLFTHLYEELGLDEFWTQRLGMSRKGTRWDLILQTLCAYRFIDPGSEWKLHRHWFEQSAMADLLGADFSLAEIHKLYSCLDLLLKHKNALFDHLTERWKDLFNAKFEVLLYDLTSTYFESDPPFGDKRQFGYSRDKRPDCVQVVVALVVTPEGFPLAYEVLSGNTSDKTTLGDFLKKIEAQYGRAERIWVMDRGIPTEKILAQMRASKPPVYYLVGTPKGRLTKLQEKLTELPWHAVRDGVEVKLLPHEGELYVLAQSHSRIDKERAMRRRQLKALWKRLHELKEMKCKRDALLLKLGAAKAQWPQAWRLIEVTVAPGDRSAKSQHSLSFRLKKDLLRDVRRREGRYLLRTNLCDKDPAKLWEFYMQLVQVEQAFKDLKGDLGIRPLFHQRMHRIEAHIFVAFLAYCLHVTLRRRLRDLAPGLTPRAVIDKFRAIQMIDVHLPTTDGRTVILSRYTQPERDLKMLIEKLKLTLPAQPPPQITASGVAAKQAV